MSEKEFVLSKIVRDSVFGAMTDFYNRLMQKKLINAAFGSGGIYVRGALATVFSGQSISPEALREEIFEEIERVRREGISPELFECARRKAYGYMLSAFNNVDDIAEELADDLLFDEDCFAGLRAAAEVTLDEGNALFLSQYDMTNSALSVVRRREEA